MICRINNKFSQDEEDEEEKPMENSHQPNRPAPRRDCFPSSSSSAQPLVLHFLSPILFGRRKVRARALYYYYCWNY
jgi:hypothetical protein